MATFAHKVRLIQGLLRGDTALTGPLYVSVAVTRRCNLHCVGCIFHSPHVKSPFFHRDTLDFPVDLFRELCADLRAVGTDEMILTGEGEPLLHPRIFDLIQIARDSGLRSMMFTNGTLLNHERSKLLVESGLTLLKVSLWAGSPEAFHQNYPGTDSAHFQTVVEGIVRLVETRRERRQKTPAVLVRHIVNQSNAKELASFIDLAAGTGSDGIELSALRVFTEGSADYALSPPELDRVRGLLPRIAEQLNARDMRHNIPELLLRYRIGPAVWEKMPCYVGWFHSHIGVDGEVLPCCTCARQMGSLRESRFPEIWNNEAYRAFRRQTATREGLAAAGDACRCHYCSYVGNNHQVHRTLRWLSPFSMVVRRRPLPGAM